MHNNSKRPHRPEKQAVAGIELAASDSAHVQPRRGGSVPANTPALQGLLTVRGVAKYLQIHEKTVYEWVAKGQLPCIRLGNRLRFDPSDITRWVASRREGA